MRADLPVAAAEGELVEYLCDVLATQLATQEVSAITVVVVGGLGDRPQGRRSPPRGRLIKRLRHAFEGLGLPLLHALWTARVTKGARWRCYQDADCTGTLPDPDSSVVAATTAARGRVTYKHRQELVDSLRADPAEALDRRAALIGERMSTMDSTSESAEVTAARGRKAVLEALNAEENGQPRRHDDLIAELAMALAQTAVRDWCLHTAVPVDSLRALAAERLWTWLTKSTPAPERAEPACLLGYAAYVRGDGALARVAFEAALDAHPGHTLSRLLMRALENALPPEQIAVLATSGTRRGATPGTGAASGAVAQSGGQAALGE